MGTKDIPDKMVCLAYREFLKAGRDGPWPYELLERWSEQPQKVCYRACERAERRGLIEYGVSLRTGWLTEKGKALIGDSDNG